MGRKNRYDSHVKPRLAEIKEWYSLFSEEQIAKKLGISTSTFANYKNAHPELQEALREGVEQLKDDLKISLKKKAQGYYYEETKTFVKEVDGKTVKTVEKFKRYAHPDTGAIHLLLKNLDESWHNDDAETIALRREKLELEKQKAEQDNW